MEVQLNAISVKNNDENAFSGTVLLSEVMLTVYSVFAISP